MKRHSPVIFFILISLAGQADTQVIWQKLNLPEEGKFTIQASPNEKLFLSMRNNLYISTDEGDTWKIQGPSAGFQIDSQGVFFKVTLKQEKFSIDEGRSWVVDSNLPAEPEAVAIIKDSIYIFAFDQYGTDVYVTGNYGKNWRLLGVFFPMLSWSGSYVSPLNKVYGTQTDCSCMVCINDNNRKLQISLSQSSCWADNSPPEEISFDYSGYGYAYQLCNLLRSSDSGRTWVPIDSGRNSTRYWPPYLPLLNNNLIAVTDTVTMLSSDHADTWQKIGDGIKGAVDYHRDFPGFVDRKGFAFTYTDSALYRMSLYASVQPIPSITVDIIIHFDPSLNQISLQSLSTLGPTTASLYTIDGRLLKRKKLDIPSPGIFSFDVSDVHTHFAIMVLQTGKGVITKKIIF